MPDDKKADPVAAAAEAGKPAKYLGTPEGQVPRGPEQAPAQNTHTATAAEQARDTFGGPDPAAAAPAPAPAMVPKRGNARQQGAAYAEADRARLQPSIDTATLGAAIVAAQQQIYKLTSQQVGTPDLDKTIPGGLYVVDGRCVNAHGDEIKDPRPRPDDDGKD